MALGPIAWSRGFRCISLLHTRAHAHSPRLASSRQGKASLAWYGMVWYRVLAPNASVHHLRDAIKGGEHRATPVETNIVQETETKLEAL